MEYGAFVTGYLSYELHTGEGHRYMCMDSNPKLKYQSNSAQGLLPLPIIGRLLCCVKRVAERLAGSFVQRAYVIVPPGVADLCEEVSLHSETYSLFLT